MTVLCTDENNDGEGDTVMLAFKTEDDEKRAWVNDGDVGEAVNGGRHDSLTEGEGWKQWHKRKKYIIYTGVMLSYTLKWNSLQSTLFSGASRVLWVILTLSRCEGRERVCHGGWLGTILRVRWTRCWGSCNRRSRRCCESTMYMCCISEDKHVKSSGIKFTPPFLRDDSGGEGLCGGNVEVEQEVIKCDTEKAIFTHMLTDAIKEHNRVNNGDWNVSPSHTIGRHDATVWPWA